MGENSGSLSLGQASLLLVALGSAVFSACGVSDSAPPQQAGGKELYRTQACATCHGESAQGTANGPALAGISQRWSLEELAQYFGDPEPVRAQRDDLRSMEARYPARMPAYKHLTSAERERLANYLLTL